MTVLTGAPGPPVPLPTVAGPGTPGGSLRPGPARAAAAGVDVGRNGPTELVIVANRLPVRRVPGAVAGRNRGWEPSPGGLASALVPVARRRGARWIGWSGAVDDDIEGIHDGIRFSGVPLGAAEIAGSYTGFSNTTIWPLFHDALRPSVFDDGFWDAYVQVNRRFAARVVAAAPRGATVWVHDYQLMLVPALVSAARPDLGVGFFLHIPFPAPELFRRLPWRRVLLDGLSGASLLGFQDHLSAANADATLRRHHCGRPASGHRAGTPVTGVFPVGVDVAEIEDRVRSAEAARYRSFWRDRLGGATTVLLGVDRLDYTKGIDQRLAAFERLLDRGALDAASTRFVQVCAPSRAEVPGYREVRTRVEAAATRIAARHTTAAGSPLVLVDRAVTPAELVALMGLADVMVVTPLRDGMNLVAKEFVAARSDLGGALVLSEFAGAADELDAAHLVNPFDVEDIAAALHAALVEPPARRRDRMRVMRAVVCANTSGDWARRFLTALAARGPGARAGPATLPAWAPA
jgi:trehalose 6-phosphate synthase